MKKTMWSSVVSLLAAGVLMGGCGADVGAQSESEGRAAQGPNVVAGEALGEAKQALSCSILYGGQTLSANQSITSCDGRFRLITQGDGNVVVYGPSGAVWANYIFGAGNRLVMQADGDLVVYSSSNQALWRSRTGGNPGAWLTLHNDGNLVIYSSSHHALWQSRWCGGLYIGQTIPAGKYITSCNGRFALHAQAADGNVVLYGPTGALWATYRYGAGNRLVLQGDGNLVVYTPSNQALWSSGTAGNPGARLAIQDDGNLMLYSHFNQVLWTYASGIVR